MVVIIFVPVLNRGEWCDVSLNINILLKFHGDECPGSFEKYKRQAVSEDCTGCNASFYC